MKLIRCNNGHFYDQDKFGSCPYCSGGDSASDSMTEAFSESVTTPLQTPPSNPMANKMPGTVAGNTLFGAVPTGAVSPQPQPPVGEMGVTVKKPEEIVSKSLEQAMSQIGPTMPLQQPNNLGNANLNNISNSISSGIGTINSMGSINNMFSTSEDEDYTVAMTPGGKTMGASGLKPVVGWLICLSGEHIGKDFRLVQGKNFIGRDSSMDVCLDKEKTVSRDKHALIVYEPKHHMFLIQTGESKELTYVNDKVILESKELSPFDEILVGDVKLLFVPLCNEKFNWADVLEGKDETDEESK